MKVHTLFTLYIYIYIYIYIYTSYILQLVYISSFEDASHIFSNTQSSGLLVLIVLYTLVFTSAHAIFHNFLELYSTLSETRFFHGYFFLNGFTCPFLIPLI